MTTTVAATSVQVNCPSRVARKIPLICTSVAVTVLSMDEKNWPQHEALAAWIPRGMRGAFATQIGVSGSHLGKMCSGHHPPSPELCVTIERATLGRVTRLMLRPDLFGDLTEAG